MAGFFFARWSVNAPNRSVRYSSRPTHRPILGQALRQIAKTRATMIRTQRAPGTILNASPGTILLEPTRAGLQLYLREEKIKLGNYPRPCGVDVRLPSWEINNTVVVALVLRFAHKEKLTFQTWINPRDLRGCQTLGNLAGESQIDIHLVTDEVARSFATVNTVKRHALKIQAKLAALRNDWTAGDFEAAKPQVDTLYPTPSALWRACERSLNA